MDAGPAQRAGEALRLGLIPEPERNQARGLLVARERAMDHIASIDDDLAKLVQQYHPYRMIKDNPQA